MHELFEMTFFYAHCQKQKLLKKKEKQGVINNKLKGFHIYIVLLCSCHQGITTNLLSTFDQDESIIN